MMQTRQRKGWTVRTGWPQSAIVLYLSTAVVLLLSLYAILQSGSSLPSYYNNAANDDVSVDDRMLRNNNMLAQRPPLTPFGDKFYEYEQEFPYPLTCDKNELHNFLQNNYLIDASTGKMNITLVYHIGMVGNWKTVVADQFNTLHKCGTLGIADRLFLTYSNGDKETLDTFIDTLLESNKHKLSRRIIESTKSPWEAPAMNTMVEYCNGSSSPKKEVIFYFHNKGTSKWTKDWRDKKDVPFTYSYVLYWRKYLEYFTIERPHLCLDKLLLSSEDYTTCGPNYHAGAGPNQRQITEHYSGNFFATTCEHINHLEPILTNETSYTATEMWIVGSTWKGKPAKLTTNFKKLYRNLVLPEKYALV